MAEGPSLNSSSGVYTIHGALEPLPTSLRRLYFSTIGVQPLDVEVLSSNYRIHKHLIRSSANAPEESRPIAYVRYRTEQPLRNHNSASESVTALALESYRKIEDSLSRLAEGGDNCEVEDGAVKSAMTVVDQLKASSIMPPAMSTHGGDAVVMLWAIGDTTYAITVTDGEIGYVVRRNRKAIKMVDSIRIDSFRLESLV